MRLKIQIKHELAGLLGLSTLLVLSVYLWPTPALRIALGPLYILLFPGYALVAALLPRNDALKNSDRVALSFGLSIAVVPLIVLLLDYTPWGIRLEPILVLVTLFILLCSGVAHYRRSRLPVEDRFAICLELDLPRWQRMGRLDKFLSMILALSIVVAIGALVYAIATPKAGERFTEFYILGPEGLAENYPREAVVGQPVTVTVGIANREGVSAEYRLSIISEEYLVGQAGPVRLEPEATDERPVRFTPMVAGDDVKVVFWLYREGVEEPYRSLRLWLKVTE